MKEHLCAVVVLAITGCWTVDARPEAGTNHDGGTGDALPSACIDPSAAGCVIPSCASGIYACSPRLTTVYSENLDGGAQCPAGYISGANCGATGSQTECGRQVLGKSCRDCTAGTSGYCLGGSIIGVRTWCEDTVSDSSCYDGTWQCPAGFYLDDQCDCYFMLPQECLDAGVAQG